MWLPEFIMGILALTILIFNQESSLSSYPPQSKPFWAWSFPSQVRHGLQLPPSAYCLPIFVLWLLYILPCEATSNPRTTPQNTSPTPLSINPPQHASISIHSPRCLLSQFHISTFHVLHPTATTRAEVLWSLCSLLFKPFVTMLPQALQFLQATVPMKPQKVPENIPFLSYPLPSWLPIPTFHFLHLATMAKAEALHCFASLRFNQAASLNIYYSCLPDPCATLGILCCVQMLSYLVIHKRVT